MGGVTDQLLTLIEWLLKQNESLLKQIEELKNGTQGHSGTDS